ncbi:MAG TPA: hypothetical protein DEG06_09935 [Lachnospiraceae bacterium]|mgnify:FL=1|jgi:hypothetical protein|nr:hypothetical protein [Lachnospiraceae bacterium]HCA70828.1 hypothetical protein [Lachnospiraceae bacterium]
METQNRTNFINALDYGFTPEASGIENRKALQKAVEEGGTIVISEPGTYKLAGTVYIGSYTSLLFANNTFIQKVNEEGWFSHVLLNKGALTKTYDTGIRIEHLHIIVNGMDIRKFEVEGLHGQLAFFYVKDLHITGFRCMDLGKWQYGIQICTFEDIIVKDVIIKGDKDGVHLGRGKRFLISEGIFDTYDDAVALNGHDYDVGNPELGWIEDGIVEKCQDLTHDGKCTDGYFCRMLAGAWVDWYPGIKLQKSDTVVANGRMYRVKADPDGKEYTSTICPSHEKGIKVIEGITWVVVQEDVTYTAGVRNVTFRDIYLHKPRTGFSIHFDNDRYSRSYYPGAEVPHQEQIMFDGIRVTHNQKAHLMEIGTPVDVINMVNSNIRNNTIYFHGNNAMEDYEETKINICGCIFNGVKQETLIENTVENKIVKVNYTGNMEM